MAPDCIARTHHINQASGVNGELLAILSLLVLHTLRYEIPCGNGNKKKGKKGRFETV